MIYGLMAVLALLPAVVIGGVAGVTRLVLGTRAPAFQVALWISATAAAVYAGWQTLEFYRDTHNRNIAVGSVLFIAMPLFASAIALLAFGYGWGLGAMVIESVRLSNGSTRPLAAAARCLLPLGAMLTAIYFTAVVVLPSAADRVDRARTAEELAPLFERAMRDSDIDVLQSLANSAVLPPDKLDALSRHPDPWVRCRVAFNRRTPPPTLERLADDPASDVRLGLVGNDAASDALLERMSALNDESGRAASEALRIRRATTQPTTAPEQPPTG